jgi:hypothetical protein
MERFDMDSTLSGSVDQFSVGIQLAALIEYYQSKQSNLPEDVTTKMFCEQVILPETEQLKCSLVELFRNITPSAVGQPVGFISHAWQYTFRSLIEAMVNYFGKDAYVWLDFVCCNQHKAPNYPFEWWDGTFKSAISSIGKTVMVVDPWDNPIPLTRGWCVWEMYCTIDSEG